MIQFGVALRWARAETRRARGMLLFSVLSIALGVFAVTAIRGLTTGVRDGIEGQAQRLLGADLAISASEPFLPGGPADALFRDLEQNGARQAQSVRLYSMLARSVAPAAGKSTQLVRVRAAGDGFPFYGSIDTIPAAQFAELGREPSLLLDPAVRSALNLSVGDRVRLGRLEAVVLGEFVKAPGSPAAEFSMAPYVFMHEKYLPATELLATGSRVQYEALFALPPGLSAETWKEAHWDEAVAARLTLRTSREAAANVRRFLSRLSGFMTVVGLITLFLGALGIGSAMFAFMNDRLDHAAILRCVGATSRDLLLVYGLLALGVGLVGSSLGAAGGALVPLLLAKSSDALGSGFLPAELVSSPSLAAVLHGFGAGLFTTLAFTLVPIWRTSQVAPLRVLGRKSDSLESLGSARWTAALGIGAGFLAIFVLSLAETESLRIGVSFTLALGLSLVVLFGVARLVVALARALGPRLPSFHLRQGIKNLHRPGNQTYAVVVAVGMGFLLLGTLLILQRSLEELLAFERRDDLPNTFVIDIQADQFEPVSAMLTEFGSSDSVFNPMVSARISRVNGESVDQSRVERNDVQRSWEDRMRTREYFLSYRADPVDSETITHGQFWSGKPEQQEASLDEGLATNLGIRLGDTLTLDIQGLPLDARVTSFREIRWQSLRPNAMILLSPGEIEAAPKMIVASGRVATVEARRQLSERLVARFPNLTVIDASEAAQTVLSILDRVSLVFSVLGALAVISGAVILGGAIAAGRFARQREAMLFKVLGASRADLWRILGSEYAALALLGTLAGWLLAEAVGRTAIPALFDASASVPYGALGLLGASALVLNVLTGWFVGRRVSAHPPLAILREES